MKKTNRLVTIFLMACMVLASGGLLYATMYASGAGTQSTQTTVAFDAPSGIRYNELTGAFEVFSGVGVSWIGSNGWVSTLGNYDKNTATTPTQTETTGVWYKATRTATYNIMCDIAYKSVYVPGSTTTFVTAYNEAFNNGITLEAGGKIYGRGFYLSGFPIRNAAKSSALIATNNGIIRNVNILDAHFNKVTGTELTSVGILCAINGSNGVLDDCGVYGEYSSDKFPSMYGVAAENSGTIMNCKNNAKLINSGTGDTFTAGITEVLANSNVVNNVNNGALVGRTPFSSSAGIAFCKSDVEGIISGNKNNAVVSAVGTATGVLGGLETFETLRISGNENNGELFAEKTFFNYYGVVLREANPGELPPNGIRWNPDLGLFEIYNSAGVSHISMGHWFNAEGLMRTTSATDYKQATMESHYRIMNDIVYNALEPGFNKDFATVPAGKAPRIGVGGIVDGGGHTLSGFPIRSLNENINSKLAYSAFLLYTRGTVVNVNMLSYSTDISVSNGIVAMLTVGAAGILSRCSVGGVIDVNLSGTDSTSGSLWAASGITGSSSGSYFALTGIDNMSFVKISSNISTAILGTAGSTTTTTSLTRIINFGNITATGFASGILSNPSTLQIVLDNCINYGNITSTTRSASGIAGEGVAKSYTWKNCINYGDITGVSGAGGIFDYYGQSSARAYEGMKNYGNIISTTANSAGSIIGVATASNLNSVTLKNCENYGGVGTSLATLQYGADAPFAGGAGSKYHGENGNISVDPR